MFVVNTTGSDVLIHEINARIPSGDGLYQIPDSLKENYPQLSKIPGAIIKKLDDRLIALEEAEKKIEELQKIVDSYTIAKQGDKLENFPEKEITNVVVEQTTTKKGRGRPFKFKKI